MRYVCGKLKKSGDSKLTKLNIRNMGYSEPYPYSANKPLNFYKETHKPKQPYAVALSLTIPSTCKKPLVFLIPKKNGSLEHMVYDLDANKFPYGSIKVVNFTPKNLYANLGGKKFQVKPKSSHLVPSLSHGKPKAVSCKVAVNNKGKAQPVYSSMMMARPYKRVLLFFYPTKDEVGRTVVRCRSLNDFETKPKRSAASASL